MDSEPKTVIYVLTQPGAHLAQKISSHLNADILVSKEVDCPYTVRRFESLLSVVGQNFRQYSHHIFITAAGIAVRAIAPHIRGKDVDPAVIVLDHYGRWVISLLSGHLGGANDMARHIALFTGGEAVITTATDLEGLKAIDVIAREKDLIAANPEAIKKVNRALLEGRTIQVFDPQDRLGLACGPDSQNLGVRIITRQNQMQDNLPGVLVTWNKSFGTNFLVLHPKCLVVGIGCNRGTSCEEIVNLLQETFEGKELSLKSIKCLTSSDIKKDESGLLLAARFLGVPLEFVSHERLKGVAVPTPSQQVKNHMGVLSVCEASALVQAGSRSILVPKVKSLNATLAVALVS